MTTGISTANLASVRRTNTDDHVIFALYLASGVPQRREHESVNDPLVVSVDDAECGTGRENLRAGELDINPRTFSGKI